MRAKFIIGAAALVAGALGPSANAIGLGAAGGGGGISPSSDLGACASLTFDAPTTAVGQFTAVAELQGPGTKVGTVRDSIPVLVTSQSSWSRCIPGAYSGATTGEAKYTLTANSPKGDFVDVVQCTVALGVRTCH